MTRFEELAKRIEQCIDCPLSKTRTKAVPGDGPSTADIMMIGEGPGFHEDRQGLPFVGPAGKFLDQLITSSGLKRKDVFITNVVKCRPPNNRDPLPGEIEACRKHLDEQIEIINPKVIVTLGRFSMARFIPNQTIGRVRAKARQVEERTIYPMYHPAAALHNGNLRSVIEDDFKAIPGLVDKAAPTSRSQSHQPSSLTCSPRAGKWPLPR